MKTKQEKLIIGSVSVGLLVVATIVGVIFERLDITKFILILFLLWNFVLIFILNKNKGYGIVFSNGILFIVGIISLIFVFLFEK